MKILIVVDQPRRDAIIAKKINAIGVKRKYKIIKSSSYMCIANAMIFKPDVIIIGNADTYHSVYVRLLRSYVKCIASIPTEQYFVTTGYKSNYFNQWQQYVKQGHTTPYEPAYSYIDTILTYGEKQKKIIKSIVSDSVNVDAIGPIRLPALEKVNRKSIGIVLDQQDELTGKMVAEHDTSWFGGDNHSTGDILIWSKYLELTLFETIKLLGNNFPETNLIVRPRFNSKNKVALKSLDSFLSKYVKHYEIDISNSLQYMAENCYVVLSGESTASIEFQILGIPSINVMRLQESKHFDKNSIHESYGSMYPYRYSWKPEDKTDLYNIIELASMKKLNISPIDDQFYPHIASLFGFHDDSDIINSAERTLDLIEELYLRCEKYTMYKKDEVLENILIAKKFNLLPKSIPRSWYLFFCNFNILFGAVFWTIVIWLQVARGYILKNIRKI